MIEQCVEVPEGLYSTDRHLNYRWTGDGRTVYFSAAQQGQAMTIHIAAEGKNKLGLRKAAVEFVDYLFDSFPWCRVVMGGIKKKSVVNLALKCGFEHLADGQIDDQPGTIVARFRV